MDSWDSLLQAAYNKEIDIICAAKRTPEREKHLLFTKPFISIPEVIVTSKANQRSLTIEDLKDIKVTMVEGYAILELVKKQYPWMIIEPCESDLAGPLEVSFGVFDAMLIDLTMASYLIEKHGIDNLRVAGYTDIEADETHDLYDDLKAIQTAAECSADITKQLPAFARKQTISPRKMDLNDTVESMLKMLHRLIGEDINMAWIPDEEVWPVKIDPAQIDQVPVNLCVNARDAIPDVGKITIETGNMVFDEDYCKDHAGFVPGEYSLLAVSDNGCGMDAATLANVFEPFFTTKESNQGTGLGLDTVYGKRRALAFII